MFLDVIINSNLLQLIFISSRVLSSHLRLGRPLLPLPGTTMSIIFLERLSSSLLLMCPYQFNPFCIRNVDIWPILASSCIFLTCSFLVLLLIHRSILISATRSTLCSMCHCWLDHCFMHLVFHQLDEYLFVAQHTCQLLYSINRMLINTWDVLFS